LPTITVIITSIITTIIIVITIIGATITATATIIGTTTTAIITDTATITIIIIAITTTGITNKILAHQAFRRPVAYSPGGFYCHALKSTALAMLLTVAQITRIARRQ
jgi:hypothetical protein